MQRLRTKNHSRAEKNENHRARVRAAQPIPFLVGQRLLRDQRENPVTTFVAILAAIVVGAWVMETLLFFLSYRTSQRSQETRSA